MTAADARRPLSRRVTITLTVAEPPFTWKSWTVCGAADRPDGLARGAVLKGERCDVREGDTVTMTGTLRYRVHPPSKVGRRTVPGWVEVSVVEE